MINKKLACYFCLIVVVISCISGHVEVLASRQRSDVAALERRAWGEANEGLGRSKKINLPKTDSFLREKHQAWEVLISGTTLGPDLSNLFSMSKRLADRNPLDEGASTLGLAYQSSKPIYIPLVLKNSPQQPQDSTRFYLPLVLKNAPILYDYYVDCVNGDDDDLGTSLYEAWRTLTPVHETQFKPGDTVHLKRGCTWSGGLFIDDDGEDGRPITFTAYGEGARPILTNPGSLDNQTIGIEIRADWIVVKGVMVQDAYRTGIWTGDYNVIQDNEITAAGAGISVRGSYNLITQNYIHDLRMINNTPGGDDDYGATGITFFAPDNEASHNYLLRCSAQSYDYGRDGGGFATFLNADRTYIHHNWVENSDGFIEVGMSTINDVTIAYNVSVNNNAKFSLLSLEGQFASEVDDLRVEHNTIIEYANEDWEWAIFRFVGDPTNATFVVRNNIVYVEKIWEISNKSSFAHNHNLYRLGEGTALGFELGADEQIANPQFVSLDDHDFRLRASSPAINQGASLGYTVDFEGKPVPVNGVPDLGAFEYAGFPDRPPTPTPTLTPTPLPTPQPDEIIVDDADAGFSTTFSQDAWQHYTHIGGQHYGSTHYYNREIGTGGDVASWAFTVPQPGRYDVYAWWWAGSWRPTDVPYMMNHLNGPTTVRVNQQIDGAQWNLLGTFEFDGPGSITVSDDVSSGRDVVADAVRLVYVEPLASDSDR